MCVYVYIGCDLFHIFIEYVRFFLHPAFFKYLYIWFPTAQLTPPPHPTHHPPPHTPPPPPLVRRQAITWINADLLSIGLLGIIHPSRPLKANASCTELNLSSFMEICRRCLALPTNKPRGLILIGLDVRNVLCLLDVFMHPRVHCGMKIAFSLEKICTSDVWFFISIIYRWSDTILQWC